MYYLCNIKVKQGSIKQSLIESFDRYCKVMKLAAMPSCLEGGDYGINAA